MGSVSTFLHGNFPNERYFRRHPLNGGLKYNWSSPLRREQLLEKTLSLKELRLSDEEGQSAGHEHQRLISSICDSSNLRFELRRFLSS